jgi:hypothetical protein
MQSEFIFGVLVFIVVMILEITSSKIDVSFLRWMHNKEKPFGSKLLIAFLCGFIFFILFTGEMPNPGQKVPVIIAALLLIAANLFLVKPDDGQQ